MQVYSKSASSVFGGANLFRSNVIRYFWCALASISISSCSTPFSVVPPNQNTFKGIASQDGGDTGPELPRVTEDQPARILIIHGMSKHKADSFDDFIVGISQR